jgi:hypothetical protein
MVAALALPLSPQDFILPTSRESKDDSQRPSLISGAQSKISLRKQLNSTLKTKSELV